MWSYSLTPLCLHIIITSYSDYSPSYLLPFQCYTGYYGSDCSNSSCPGTFCQYDPVSLLQVRSHKFVCIKLLVFMFCKFYMFNMILKNAWKMLLFLSSFRVLLSCFFFQFLIVSITRRNVDMLVRPDTYIQTVMYTFLTSLRWAWIWILIFAVRTARTVWFFSLSIQLLIVCWHLSCVCCIAYAILLFYWFFVLVFSIISLRFILFPLILFYFISLYFIVLHHIIFISFFSMLLILRYFISYI